MLYFIILLTPDQTQKTTTAPFSKTNIKTRSSRNKIIQHTRAKLFLNVMNTNLIA